MSSSAFTTRRLTAAEAVDLVAGMAPVETADLEERAAALTNVGLGEGSETIPLETAVRCLDLTSLTEGQMEAEVSAMCATAVRPDPSDPSLPSVAAVCILPRFVPTAVRVLQGSGVKVAGVAGGFPTGTASTAEKVREIRDVVAPGADEVDMVLNRVAFLDGRLRETFDEIASCKEACGRASLKVILETGKLGSIDGIRKATLLSMAAGADFIKTSTGRVTPGATFPAALCMVEAIRDFHGEMGWSAGLKVAGGITGSLQAYRYMLLVRETLGRGWLSPHRFRIGASSLLEDLVTAIRRRPAMGESSEGRASLDGRHA